MVIIKNVYIKQLINFNKQELIEIDHNLNQWEWDDRLGEKPNNWDNIPNFMFNKEYTLPTKSRIIDPIREYIKSKTTEKERLKYHNVNYRHRFTPFQFEFWWIKRMFCKTFKLGFFSSKSTKSLTQILMVIANKEKDKYIQN